jgi:hypothetical protein
MSKEKILSGLNFIARMGSFLMMCMCIYQREWNEATAFGVFYIAILLEQWDTEK